MTTAPWYQRYFTPDYWGFTRYEYTAERTESEVDYLAAALSAAPGRRVLDLGCGTGRHAVPLARRGFAVTGVDVSEWALRQAAAAAAEAAVDIGLHRLDLLTERAWPVSTVDAVVCVQGVGWGTDDEQLRLLRRARRVLAPGGVLVLDMSNASPILSGFQAEARFAADGVRFEMARRYDAGSGRNLGEMRVRYPDGRVAVLPHDVRLYQPPEIRRMLVAAGFRVERTDADFVAGAPVTASTRYVQFLARADPAAGAGAGSGSAVESHRRPVPAGHLDLRWAPDEADLVRSTVDAAWSDVLREAGPAGLAELAAAYPLQDPYGGELLAPVLADLHRCALRPEQVSAGAGVTGLLYGLAALAGGGPVLAEPLGHPDLPARARALGAELVVRPLARDATATAAAIASLRPSLVVLDRPGVEGEVWTLATVRELADVAAGAGALLVLDETCASYPGPAASAVPLVGATRSLVVLRSLSKGYCCGGLRVGYAVCSPPVAAEVRAVAAPLAVSSLPAAVAVALLRRGDAFPALRRRIAQVKPDVVALLAASGLQVRPCDPRLPWVLVRAVAATAAGAAGRPNGDGLGDGDGLADGDGGDPAATAAALAALGLAARPLSRVDGRPTGWARLSVPLSAARASAFRAALAAPHPAAPGSTAPHPAAAQPVEH